MTSRLLLPVLGTLVPGCTDIPAASPLAPDDVKYAAVVTAAPEIVQ